jgi:hypothetical protein
MAQEYSRYAVIDTAASLRADLIRATQRTAQLMVMLATTYTKTAATYRRMAQQRGADGLRHLQHAARLEQRAAKARRFAEWERHQINQWTAPDVAKPTG